MYTDAEQARLIAQVLDRLAIHPITAVILTQGVPGLATRDQYLRPAELGRSLVSVRLDG